MKILHVEDNLDILAITKISLEEIGGFEVHQCSTGEDALDVMKSFIPDLFLLDVMMPNMSGCTLAKHIHNIENLKNIPIIFMTALGSSECASALQCTGVIGIITKPFDPLLLPEKILTVCHENRAS